MAVSPDKTQLDAVVTLGGKGLGHYEPVLVRAPHHEVQALLEIGQALAGKLDRGDVLGVAVGKVANIIGAEGASILLIDPDTGGMSFHLAEGPGACVAKTVPLPPGAGICGHVARTGEPLIVNNAQDDPRLYRRVDRTTGITTHNLLCTPLRSGERLWGVLELINKHDGADFDDNDLRVAEVVASQIALALANAHLHTEIVHNERMAAVGRTVSGLAHCIKNVLNGIRGGSAIVDRSMTEDDFERVREGWQVVRKNNEMLGNLVLDMLSLARDTKIHPFPTDVNDLTEQVCKLMTDRAGLRGIKVACVSAPGLDEVMVDPTQLYRCLLNLVSNAVDACDDGGNVRVRTCRGERKHRPRFTISITDDGMGISPENRKRLFAEFFTTKGNKGTGLGLPVTRKLIEKMGGKIIFHSVEGRGTRFVMALPIDNEPDNKETDS